MTMFLNNRWKKLLLIIFGIIFLAAAVSIAAHRADFSGLKDYINSFGSWAPVILLVMIIIASSIGFIFTIPVAIAALILDIYSAFVISIAGLTIGAMISFAIARYFGRDYMEREYISKIKKLRRYDEHLKKKGFTTILFLRLVSLIPYELINVTAGFSRIRVLPYFFGTLLGIIPGTLITIYFIKSTNDLASMNFVYWLIAFAMLMLLPLASKTIRKLVF